MKNLLLVASLGLCITAQAQNCKPSTAYTSNATSGVMAVDNNNDYDCGKIFIDAAYDQVLAKHKSGAVVKLKHELKIYQYRGKIYAHQAEGLKGDQKIEFIEIATESYFKVRELDAEAKGDRYNDATRGLKELARSVYRMSADFYGVQDYANALKMAEMCVSINDRLASEFLNANYNAALSALMMENYDVAIKYFSGLAEADFGDENSGPVIYSKWSYCLKRQEKLEDAFAVIQKGREKYPENSDLFKEEVDYYLQTNQAAKALENIDKLITAEPENALYYALKGDLYDMRSAEAETEEEQKEMAHKAIDAYKLSIEKDPEYLHPYFNGGATYIKLANFINKERDALSYKEVEKDKALKKKQDALYAEAISMFETCIKIAPKDESAYQALMKIYVNTGEFEKKTEVENRLKAAQEQQ